jgi:hypothetical protein
MDRGNLVCYDLTGKIIAQTGEASGAVLPHEYPVGVPYLELPYGAMDWENQRLISIDVSTVPHRPVFESIIREKTDAEKVAEYEALLRLNGIKV